MSTEIAHARITDPQTSHHAAASVAELNAKQKAVLKLFTVLHEVDKNSRVSDEQMIDAYIQKVLFEPQGYPRQSFSGLRSRRNELVIKGLIEASGWFGKTISGRYTTLWHLKPTA